MYKFLESRLNLIYFQMVELSSFCFRKKSKYLSYILLHLYLNSNIFLIFLNKKSLKLAFKTVKIDQKWFKIGFATSFFFLLQTFYWREEKKHKK